MAVGKGSMDRASKAAAPAAAKSTTVRKAAPKKTTETTNTVIGEVSQEILEVLESQASDQILDREPGENETFGIGDAMPVYYY